MLIKRKEYELNQTYVYVSLNRKKMAQKSVAKTYDIFYRAILLCVTQIEVAATDTKLTNITRILKLHLTWASLKAYWKRSLRTFSTVFTLNMKKIVPMIDCSLSITRFVT